MRWTYQQQIFENDVSPVALQTGESVSSQTRLTDVLNRQ